MRCIDPHQLRLLAPILGLSEIRLRLSALQCLRLSPLLRICLSSLLCIRLSSLLRLSALRLQLEPRPLYRLMDNVRVRISSSGWSRVALQSSIGLLRFRKYHCPFYRNSNPAGNTFLVRFEHLERSSREPKMTFLEILQCLCTALFAIFVLRACCDYMKA